MHGVQSMYKLVWRDHIIGLIIQIGVLYLHDDIARPSVYHLGMKPSRLEDCSFDRAVGGHKLDATMHRRV